MKRFSLFILLSTFAACKNQVVNDMEKYSKRVCDCPDSSCVSQVMTEYNPWVQKHMGAQGTQEDAERIKKARASMDECMAAKNVVVKEPTVVPPESAAKPAQGEAAEAVKPANSAGSGSAQPAAVPGEATKSPGPESKAPSSAPAPAPAAPAVPAEKAPGKAPN